MIRDFKVQSSSSVERVSLQLNYETTMRDSSSIAKRNIPAHFARQVPFHILEYLSNPIHFRLLGRRESSTRSFTLDT